MATSIVLVPVPGIVIFLEVKFGIGKKSRNQYRKNLVPNNVPVSVAVPSHTGWKPYSQIQRIYCESGSDRHLPVQFLFQSFPPLDSHPAPVHLPSHRTSHLQECRSDQMEILRNSKKSAVIWTLKFSLLEQPTLKLYPSWRRSSRSLAWPSTRLHSGV